MAAVRRAGVQHDTSYPVLDGQQLRLVQRAQSPGQRGILAVEIG